MATTAAILYRGTMRMLLNLWVSSLAYRDGARRYPPPPPPTRALPFPLHYALSLTTRTRLSFAAGAIFVSIHWLAN